MQRLMIKLGQNKLNDNQPLLKADELQNEFERIHMNENVDKKQFDDSDDDHNIPVHRKNNTNRKTKRQITSWVPWKR